jgi:hypothetical protein
VKGIKKITEKIISTVIFLLIIIAIFTSSEVYAQIDEGLKRMIDERADSYFNPNWNISLSQYKAWIALISLMEVDGLGYGAHSGFSLGSDVFYHKSKGSSFRFSTGIGAFQLDNGGYDRWEKWPTIDKMDPDKSLQSVLAWHKKKFWWNGATLNDFSENSAWVGVHYNNLTDQRKKEFKNYWQTITGRTWEESRSKKLDVNFNPPTIYSVYGAILEHVGLIWWNLWNSYFDTWLIHARYSDGYNQSYYYAYRSDFGYEEWVWKDSYNELKYRFQRKYSQNQYPDNRSGSYAGYTENQPALNLSKKLHLFNKGDRIKAVTDLLSVRDDAGGKWIGQKNRGDIGTISDGPKEAYYNGVLYTWWKIDWDSGHSGWSVQNWLQKIDTLPDTIPPTVDAFDVIPRIVTLGNAFTIYYTVSDTGGSRLKQVELWRANDSNGIPVDWKEIDRIYLSGTYGFSGFFKDAPSAVGTYWYGIHVVDNAGNWSVEPDPPGPIQVTVVEIPSCPSLYFWNGEEYERRGFIFPGAIPRENEYRDHIPLKHLTLKDGEYYLQIRETEPENSFIDMAKLIIVDHSSEVDIHDFFINRKNKSVPHIRTSKIWYTHDIDLNLLKENTNTIVLFPTSAEHSVMGDVMPLLRFSDNQYVPMKPGDVITLTFPYIPLQDEVRDFIFVGEGYYVPLTFDSDTNSITSTSP